MGGVFLRTWHDHSLFVGFSHPFIFLQAAGNPEEVEVVAEHQFTMRMVIAEAKVGPHAVVAEAVVVAVVTSTQTSMPYHHISILHYDNMK